MKCTKSLARHHSDKREQNVLPDSPIAKDVNDIPESNANSGTSRLLSIIDNDSSSENMDLPFVEHLPFRKQQRGTIAWCLGEEKQLNDTDSNSHHSFQHE